VQTAVDVALQALMVLTLATTESNAVRAVAAMATAAEEARFARLPEVTPPLLDAIGDVLGGRLDEARSAVLAARSSLAGRSR
jgi:hypothetical protein